MKVVESTLRLGDVRREAGYIPVIGLPFLALALSAFIILWDFGGFQEAGSQRNAIQHTTEFSSHWLVPAKKEYLVGSHLVIDGVRQGRLTLRVADSHGSFHRPRLLLIAPALFGLFCIVAGITVALHLAAVLAAPAVGSVTFQKISNASRYASWGMSWVSAAYIGYLGYKIGAVSLTDLNPF